LRRVAATWTDLRQKGGHLVREKLPFFGLAGGFSILTYHAQNALGAVADQGAPSASLRIANAMVSYVIYLRKMVLPTDLAVFYPYPQALPFWQVIGAGVFLLVLTTGVLRLKRQPWLTVGWFWYLGTLAPVIQLIYLGGHAMADRFSYIPNIGLLVSVVWGLHALTTRWPRRAFALAPAAVAAILICIPATRRQIGYWKDTETLFRRTLAVTHDNFIGHLVLGSTLSQDGRLDEAIVELETAVGLMPADVDARNNLGAALGRKGRLDEAIVHFQKAVRLKPDDAEARRNLDLALRMKRKPPVQPVLVPAP
jgi:tetratricopeptide (TPR) repeat protein